MKNISAMWLKTAATFIVVLPLLVACSRDDKANAVVSVAATPAPIAATVAPAVDEPPPALNVVTSFLDALNQHDAALASAILAENCVYFDSSLGRLQNGRQEIRSNIIDATLSGVPDGHWEIRNEPVANSDSVAFEWTFTGVNSNSWRGIGATNQKIKLKGISLVRIKDGKIVAKSDYYDTQALNRQLGW